MQNVYLHNKDFFGMETGFFDPHTCKIFRDNEVSWDCPVRGILKEHH